MSEVVYKRIQWTEYLKYRVRTRGYDLQAVEQIVRYSTERYYDTATLRTVAVGKHDSDWYWFRTIQTTVASRRSQFMPLQGRR